MKTATHIPLYILAGGQSRRFGSDKALAELDGVPLLKGVVDRLKQDGQDVTLVTGEAKRYTGFGYPVITDRPSGVGPIGGLTAVIQNCLEQGRTGWFMLASCDLVYPDRAWVNLLEANAGKTRSCAIVFRGKRWESMFGLYHTELLPLVRDHIQRHRYSMQELLDSAGAHAVELPDGLASIPQANTSAQLEASRARSVA